MTQINRISATSTRTASKISQEFCRRNFLCSCCWRRLALRDLGFRFFCRFCSECGCIVFPAFLYEDIIHQLFRDFHHFCKISERLADSAAFFAILAPFYRSNICLFRHHPPFSPNSAAASKRYVNHFSELFPAKRAPQEASCGAQSVKTQSSPM